MCLALVPFDDSRLSARVGGRVRDAARETWRAATRGLDVWPSRHGRRASRCCAMTAPIRAHGV